MKKLNFDNLTNIEVPESLIKSVLNVPNEKPKRAFFPVKFHHFAAGIAACVVIAAAVIFSLMFGLHKNVNMTAPDTPPRSESINDSIKSTSIPDVSVPSTTPPSLSGEEAQSNTNVTDPAESESSSKSIPQIKSQADVNTTQAPEGTKPDKSKQNPSQTNPQPSEAEPVTQQPTENVPQTEPEVEPTTEGQGDEPIGGSIEPWFTTHVDSRFIKGEAYCRLEDENENVLGNADLYDSSRRAYETTAYNNRVELFLIDTANLRIIPGKTYSVIFYDSRGRILKQGLVFINPNETTVYEI